MSPTSSGPLIKVTLGEGSIRVEGDLCAETAAVLTAELNGIPSNPAIKLTFDLSSLEVEDGLGLAEALRLFRHLHRRSAGLVIIGSPQLLAHNLYRVGMLEGSNPVVLVDMRHDEPHE